MRSLRIQSHQGNSYIYSEKNKSFHYIPVPMQRYIDGELPENESDYYWKKYLFWKETVLKEAEPIKLIPTYNPEVIKNNLANLRQLVIEVTDSCNLKCKYCGLGEFYANHDVRSNKKISFPVVKRFIDYLADLW